MSPLPQAAAPLVAFATRLRGAGFPVAADQTVTFLQSVDLLGPRGMADLHAAALAAFAPPPDKRPLFDAVFRAHFLGQSLAAPAAEGEEETVVHEPEPGAMEPPEADDLDTSGGEATGAEALSVRALDALSEAEALRRFARAAPARLPVRRSRRRRLDQRGDRVAMRQALRRAVARDGEVMELPRLARETRQRRILLLVDISGSMKAQSDAVLRLAHALTRAAPQVETFTIGTRLTRVTRALRLRSREQALASAAGLAPDWDGGTRIGDALAAFLSVPRFAGLARGAWVIVVSDGLERGDPRAMVEAVRRLSRLAWRLDWMTPLAADPDYAPRTEALAAVLPNIDRLGDASTTQRLCAHLLDDPTHRRPATPRRAGAGGWTAPGAAQRAIGGTA